MREVVVLSTLEGFQCCSVPTGCLFEEEGRAVLLASFLDFYYPLVEHRGKGVTDGGFSSDYRPVDVG